MVSSVAIVLTIVGWRDIVLTLLSHLQHVVCALGNEADKNSDAVYGVVGRSGPAVLCIFFNYTGSALEWAF